MFLRQQAYSSLVYHSPHQLITQEILRELKSSHVCSCFSNKWQRRGPHGWTSSTSPSSCPQCFRTRRAQIAACRSEPSATCRRQNYYPSCATTAATPRSSCCRTTCTTPCPRCETPSARPGRVCSTWLASRRTARGATLSPLRHRLHLPPQGLPGQYIHHSVRFVLDLFNVQL